MTFALAVGSSEIPAEPASIDIFDLTPEKVTDLEAVPSLPNMD
jgi:hypothetical protein